MSLIIAVDIGLLLSIEIVILALSSNSQSKGIIVESYLYSI